MCWLQPTAQQVLVQEMYKFCWESTTNQQAPNQKLSESKEGGWGAISQILTIVLSGNSLRSLTIRIIIIEILTTTTVFWNWTPLSTGQRTITSDLSASLMLAPSINLGNLWWLQVRFSPHSGRHGNDHKISWIFDRLGSHFFWRKPGRCPAGSYCQIRWQRGM